MHIICANTKRRKTPELFGGGRIYYAVMLQLKAEQRQDIRGRAVYRVFPRLQGAAGYVEIVGEMLLTPARELAELLYIFQGITTFLKGNKPPRTGTAGLKFFSELIEIR